MGEVEPTPWGRSSGEEVLAGMSPSNEILIPSAALRRSLPFPVSPKPHSLSVRLGSRLVALEAGASGRREEGGAALIAARDLEIAVSPQPKGTPE